MGGGGGKVGVEGRLERELKGLLGSWMVVTKGLLTMYFFRPKIIPALTLIPGLRVTDFGGGGHCVSKRKGGGSPNLLLKQRGDCPKVV